MFSLLVLQFSRDKSRRMGECHRLHLDARPRRHAGEPPHLVLRARLPRSEIGGDDRRHWKQDEGMWAALHFGNGLYSMKRAGGVDQFTLT